MRRFTLLAAAVLLTSFTAKVQGGVFFTDRALLSAGNTEDNFDDLTDGIVSTLNRPGVEFSVDPNTSSLSVDFQTFSPGLPSRAVQALTGDLVIEFLSEVTEFGFDTFNFNQVPDLNARVEVFAGNGSSLGSEDIVSPEAFTFDNNGQTPQSAFIGFRDLSGIKKVVFSSLVEDNSPNIDNLSFGGTPVTQPQSGNVPEPASFAVFGLGTMLVVVGGARRRRKD